MITALRELVWACAVAGGLGCAGSAKPELSDSQGVGQPVALPNADSATAAQIARAFVAGVLDTANIEVIMYERADSGHVFGFSRRLPAGISQLDGGCTVLVDSMLTRPRIVGPRRDKKCSL
jgi:hypothetical protein